MRKMKNLYKNSILFILLASLFSACELDERIGDLTGGYEGTFIDKKTNDPVFTEYYGAKLRLLDLAYGDVAQPLDFYALPNGTFKNTKIFPATYKIWAEGPFLEMDTIQSKELSGMQNFDLKVTPNVSLEIEDIKVLYGIGLEVKYSYRVNDLSSGKQQIGIVYSDLEYPGYRNSAFAGVDESALAIKHIHEVTAIRGTITDLLFLNPNAKYYVRATGHSENAGDYWNYSKQEVIETSDLDVGAIPLEVQTGARSNSSAVLQIALPPIDGLSFKVEYTDKDGSNISEIQAANDYAYAANLSENATTDIKVSLMLGDDSGSPVTVQVATKEITDLYLNTDCERPSNVPLYYSEDMQHSISDWQVQTNLSDEGWKTDPNRHIFISWWSAWSCTWLPAAVNNLPTCGQMANATELSIYGNIKSLVDLLVFSNLETLTIEVGQELFSTGETVSKDLNLKPLGKLLNLKTVIIGSGVPLTQADFDAAGLGDLTIVKN